MKKSLLIMFSCVFALNSCFSQTSKDVVSKESGFAEQHADSGKYDNGIKAGRWVEYNYDTVQAIPVLIVEGDNKREGELPQNLLLRKATGNYVQGLRDGKWIIYTQVNNQEPPIWNKTGETDYQSGMKHGLDISYGIAGDTITVASYVNGKEYGIGKLFHPNLSNKVWKLYKAANGESRLLKEFYTSGQLKSEIIEIGESNVRKLYKVKLYHENGQLATVGQMDDYEEWSGKWISYHENGKLKSEANYKDGIENGLTRFYHENGQLWSERVYVDGKLWEVKSNFDRLGKKKDKGSLSKGTGDVKLYDTNGDLQEVVKYINGVEQK
jgi:antitoxin component YwqK of YwqJK toxin-antitoxin module